MSFEKPKKNYPLIIAVDYDDTIAHGPFDGEQSIDLGIVEKLKRFRNSGAQIVLWTCRMGDNLLKAEKAMAELGLAFDSVNKPCQAAVDISSDYGIGWDQRKVYGHLYVDDKAPGSIEFFKGLTPVGTLHEYLEQVKTENCRPGDIIPILPEGNKEREEYPLFNGLIGYFPHACAEVAHHSYISNEQHNPGEQMHWAKEKSIGRGDKILRHLAQGLLTKSPMYTPEWHEEVKHLRAQAWRAFEILERKLTGLPPFDVTDSDRKEVRNA